MEDGRAGLKSDGLVGFSFDAPPPYLAPSDT
jgi:hypothetical protein